MLPSLYIPLEPHVPCIIIISFYSCWHQATTTTHHGITTSSPCFQISIYVRIVYHVLMAIYDVAGLMAPSSDVVWYNLPVIIVFDDGAANPLL